MINSHKYTELDLPVEFLSYQTEPEQMGVGKSGKIGILNIVLEKDKFSKKTEVKDYFQQIPLCIKRALYIEETCPEMAYIYVISPSGGILQGDRFSFDITLKKNAISHITTQSATRIYKMEKNFGTQTINLTVDENCYLEFIPDQIIPFRKSRFFQQTYINVHDTATLIYSEILSAGRVARGESFEYDLCVMKAIAVNQFNKTRMIDSTKLIPNKMNFRSQFVLGKYDTLGNVYVLSPSKFVTKIRDTINDIFKSSLNTIGSSSILPDNNGVIVRILGGTASDIRDMIYLILGIVRKIILNISFSGMRKA